MKARNDISLKQTIFDYNAGTLFEARNFYYRCKHGDLDLFLQAIYIYVYIIEAQEFLLQM